MQSNFPRYFVDVILPLALPKTYTYYLTEEQFIKLRPGHRVTVSFGKEKIYTAIVKKLITKFQKYMSQSQFIRYWMKYQLSLKHN